MMMLPDLKMCFKNTEMSLSAASVELGISFFKIRNVLPEKTENVPVEEVSSATTPPG